MPRQNSIYYNILLRLYIGRINIRYKAQVLLEYGLILILIATTIIGIQLYVKRGLQARYKDAADNVIEEIRQAKEDLTLFHQYEPYYEQSDITTISNSNITNSYSPGGASSNERYEKTARTGDRLELPYSGKAGE